MALEPIQPERAFLEHMAVFVGLVESVMLPAVANLLNPHSESISHILLRFGAQLGEANEGADMLVGWTLQEDDAPIPAGLCPFTCVSVFVHSITAHKFSFF
ncbi:MAG: hypothetical protein IT365_24550 [Candidatus Hydrogenedentes bacterium]|nr:hypothetical protein [Candidatus Hydrogenedentota bacterium]